MDRPANKSFVLDGTTYYTDKDISLQHLATYPDRVVFGDPTAKDHEYFSSWGLRKVPGGLGIEEYDEGTDAERLWWACLDTRYGRGLTLPPKVTATRPAGVPADAVSYPLGVIGTQVYVCFVYAVVTPTYSIYGWNQTDGEWHPTANDLTAEPVGKPVTFAGTSTKRVFVPLGSNGYAVLAESDPGNGTLSVTVVAGAADPDAIAFCVYTIASVPQLYAIQADGYLFQSVTTGLTGTWVQPDNGLSGASQVRIDASETPRHLLVYPGGDRLPAMHCVTDRGVWVYNHMVPIFERTHFIMAPHPHNALGATVWRPGEHLHITQGLERWTYAQGDVYIPGTGPAKDDGVPARFRGRLVDLEPEVSFLFAPLVGSNASTYTETFVEDAGSNYDDAIYVSPNEAFSALLCDTGLGWHCLWESAQPTDLTWGMVAGISPGYAYWFGGDKGDVYVLPLRSSFYNARQGAKNQLDSFAKTGYFITGWFDAAMLNFDKLAYSLAVTMDDATASEFIDVSYQIDDGDETWLPLGRISASGKSVLKFGVDGEGIPRGIAFNRLRLKFDFQRGEVETLSPIFVAYSLNFLKIPQDAQTFDIDVPIPEDGYDLLSADEIRDRLAALLVSRRFVVFEHARRRWLVLVTRNNGADATGRNPSGGRLLTLLAVERLADAA